MSNEAALEYLDINSILTPNRKHKAYESLNTIEETPLPSKSTAPNTCIKHNAFREEAGIVELDFNSDAFLAE
jgi:hypothetical protein